jgi:hypothetical protein
MIILILFLPTIRTQQFSDSFKGFTFFVEKKKIMKLKIFFYMIKGIILKNLSLMHLKQMTTIIAKKGIIDKKNCFYLMVK